MRDRAGPLLRSGQGAVINLDDSSGSGSHWVAARLIGGALYYADPFGTLLGGYPPEELTRLARRHVTNRTTWQRPDTHLCGYYAASFVDALNSLKGDETPEQFEKALWASIK
jgi:hypothetical protein